MIINEQDTKPLPEPKITPFIDEIKPGQTLKGSTI